MMDASLSSSWVSLTQLDAANVKDILVTMTRGLKKSKSVGELIMENLKRIYPQSRFDLVSEVTTKPTKLRTSTTSMKKIPTFKNRFERSLFHLLFRCASHPSSLSFLEQLVDAVEEFVDAFCKERILSHPVFLNLTHESLPVVTSVDLP